MTETTIRVLTGERERVLILQRPDRAYTYRRQRIGPDGWNPPGPACGLYDSAETAEVEARVRWPWLANAGGGALGAAP